MPNASKITLPIPSEDTHSFNLITLSFFFPLLLLCYFNSFTASWHFDDLGNILLNKPLHLNEFSVDALRQTFFAYPETGRFFRPVSNLTFGINWYLNEDRVLGYHLVNFSIHLFTTIFLFNTCLILLNTPVNKKLKNKKFSAFLATTLWAIHPIQTQAITYIVQRMAALAALFTIIGLWCFCRARLQQRKGFTSALYYFLSFLCFLLALGSKENAVLFPASILLLEVIFFQKESLINKRNILLFSVGFLTIIAFALFLAGPSYLLGIANSYGNRDFTLSQRLFTESRVVIFYLTQLFYPLPSRFSITHDVVLSTSLLSPLTTFPAILSLIGLTLFSLKSYRKHPLVAFAILFFLLNHTMESTIIPLEILFEHRNYLPSLFIFLPISVGICSLLERFRQDRIVIVYLIQGTIILILISLTMATITRNEAWITQKSLWEDALIKSPQSARAYINLANFHIFREKNYQKAFELCYQSLNKYSPTPWKDRTRAYNLMGQIMNLIGNQQQALVFFDKAIRESEPYPNSSIHQEVLFNTIRFHWLSGQQTSTLASMAQLVERNPKNTSFQRLYGEMLIRMKKTESGFSILKRALAQSLPQTEGYNMLLLDLSLAYGQEMNFQKSVFYSRLAQRLGAPEIPTLLCIIENNLHNKQTSTAANTLTLLLEKVTLPELMTILQETHPERTTLPFTYPLLQQFTLEWIEALK